MSIPMAVLTRWQTFKLGWALIWLASGTSKVGVRVARGHNGTTVEFMGAGVVDEVLAREQS